MHRKGLEKEIQFVSYILYKSGYVTTAWLLEKIDKRFRLIISKLTHNVRQFLGLIQHFRHLFKDYALIEKLLIKLLKMYGMDMDKY